MKKIQILLYIGMIAVVVSLIIIGIILSRSGFLSFPGSIFGQRYEMHIYIQSPPMVELGQEFQIIITVQNEGDNYLKVDKICLPEELMQVAIVKNIFPGSMEQEFLGNRVCFMIGYLMEPKSRQEFKVTLEAWQLGDVANEVQVVAGETEVSTGFRLVFMLAEVIVPTDTDTPIPTLSPTMSPIPSTSTATPVVIPYLSVVRLTAKTKYSSYMRDAWGGSGTIISPDGLILTNAHLVIPPFPIKADAYVIGLTLDPSAPPVDRYYAEPVVVDKDLDLAILRITMDIRFNSIDPKKLNLPFVALGDSDGLKLGDPLTILGYPHIGGDTITLTGGDVGGFTSERKVGERAWIKTSANISGGTSGGLVMDQNGLMVAVPTQLGYGGEEDVVDCRVVSDTNGDGRINSKDMCIPTGGFINALRPIKLALPLIEAARKAILEGLTPTP